MGYYVPNWRPWWINWIQFIFMKCCIDDEKAVDSLFFFDGVIFYTCSEREYHTLKCDCTDLLLISSYLYREICFLITLLWDTNNILCQWDPIYYFHEMLHTIDNDFAVVLYIDMFLITWSWENGIIIIRSNLLFSSNVIYHWYEYIFVMGNIT